MAIRKSLSRSSVEQIISISVLMVLILFSYAHFSKRPYLGFSIYPQTGTINTIHFSQAQSNSLREGDRVLSVNTIPWNEYINQDQILFEAASPGDQLELTISRGDITQTITWNIPDIAQGEIFARLFDSWWLAYPFWVAGTIVLIFVGPIDQRRLLLTAFFYLMAIWLATATVSPWNIYDGSFILHATSWFIIPVSLHLHWVFPQPLGRLPSWWWVIYTMSFLIIIAEWLNLIPPNGFIIAVIISVTGSLILLILHIYFQPENRKDYILFLTIIGLSLLPAVILSMAGYLERYPWFGGGGFLSLIALPVAYLFTVYRKQFSGLEFRANRVISIYLFIAILITSIIIIIAILESRLTLSNTINALTAFILAVFISSLATLLFYSPFQRFVDQKILGIQIPPSKVIETYASRISTSLDKDYLYRLLLEEIEPSLFIRQSALILFNSSGFEDMTIEYYSGIDEDQIPDREDIPNLLSQAGVYLPPTTFRVDSATNSWIYLALPLQVEKKVIGIWLLGRRDPDDYYAQMEISMLQAIADQTAIALTNIQQTEHLHSLYQANINRQELELQNLALELHDEVLSQLALIAMNPDGDSSLDSRDDYLSLSTRIREIVNGLRPALLNYGLRAALDELGDNIIEQSSDSLIVRVDVPMTSHRYDHQTELHLYRILQQACANALQHSKGSTITIQGQMYRGEVDLTVIDDGVGFDEETKVDLPSLLANNHFGLVGMYERASIIGAILTITSSPGEGTEVRILWRKDDGFEARKNEKEKDIALQII
jgi:signal transduction histidine kinase